MGPPLYSAAGGGVASEKLGQTHGGRDGHHIITNRPKNASRERVEWLYFAESAPQAHLVYGPGMTVTD